jgi:hypothetical protein
MSCDVSEFPPRSRLYGWAAMIAGLEAEDAAPPFNVNIEKENNE